MTVRDDIYTDALVLIHRLQMRGKADEKDIAEARRIHAAYMEMVRTIRKPR